jgi:hypothetical protein
VIRRVIFTGDFLRPRDTPQRLAGTPPPVFRSSQTENIIWLYRLLRRRLAEATGLPVEMKAWGQGIDTPAFYRALGLEQDTEGWITAFATRTLNREALHILEAAFQDALVVSFEAPESIKQAFTYLGIPFVDLNLHPIRFLPDVFFAAQTNTRGVFEAMKRYHTPSATYFDWADLLSAAAIKLPHLPMPPQTTLLLGQTRVDRSLIVDGQVRNLADYTAALRSLLQPGQPLMFKPHPYNPAGFGLLETGIPFGDVTWTSANIYALLAHENLSHVIGVSSSVLMEARYFDKKASSLAAPPFDIPDTAAEAVPGQYLSLYDSCFDTDFWRDVLSTVAPTSTMTGHAFRRPANALRLSLRNFWGFNEMSTDFLVELYDAGRANPSGTTAARGNQGHGLTPSGGH